MEFAASRRGVGPAGLCALLSTVGRPALAFTLATIVCPPSPTRTRHLARLVNTATGDVAYAISITGVLAGRWSINVLCFVRRSDNSRLANYRPIAATAACYETYWNKSLQAF